VKVQAVRKSFVRFILTWVLQACDVAGCTRHATNEYRIQATGLFSYCCGLHQVPVQALLVSRFEVHRRRRAVRAARWN